MKRFTFPLERVRQYRKLRLETEQANLERCHGRLAAVDEMITELERQRGEADNEVRSAEQGGTRVLLAELQGLAGYRSYAGRVGQMLAQRRYEALRAIEEQRRKTIEARRQFEMLDQSRENAKREWMAAFDREQESVAGELYLAKWKRRASAY